VWTTIPDIITIIFNSYYSICLCLIIGKFISPFKVNFLSYKIILSRPDVGIWLLHSGGLGSFNKCLPRRCSCFSQATENEGMTVMHMINSHSIGQNTVMWLDHTGQHVIWKINILCEHLTSLTQNVISLLKFIYFEYNTKEKKSVFYLSIMLVF
jgi:hypothetical protein